MSVSCRVYSPLACAFFTSPSAAWSLPKSSCLHRCLMSQLFCSGRVVKSKLALITFHRPAPWSCTDYIETVDENGVWNHSVVPVMTCIVLVLCLSVCVLVVL